MNKRGIIFLSMLFCAIIASAQIQRKILGFDLSSRTISKATVANYLKKHYKSYRNLGNRYQAGSTDFGGVTWSSVIFTFDNNRLYQIEFIENDMTCSLSSMDSSFNWLKKTLNEKYSRYYHPAMSNEELITYHDGVIMLDLDHRIISGNRVLSLTYTNVAIFEEKIRKYGSEL